MKKIWRLYNGFKIKDQVIPDFPKPGISFKDITTLLADGEAFGQAIKEIASKLRKNIDVIVGGS